jgi:hypothetical protein
MYLLSQKPSSEAKQAGPWDFKVNPHSVPVHSKKRFPAPSERVNPYLVEAPFDLSASSNQAAAAAGQEREEEDAEDLLQQDPDEDDHGVMSEYSSDEVDQPESSL